MFLYKATRLKLTLFLKTDILFLKSRSKNNVHKQIMYCLMVRTKRECISALYSFPCKNVVTKCFGMQNQG